MLMAVVEADADSKSLAYQPKVALEAVSSCQLCNLIKNVRTDILFT